MRTSTFIAAGLVAAAHASVVRQDRQGVPELGGPLIPDADRICTKSGEKCAGAVGEALVVFKGCCDDQLVCGVPTGLPDDLWGQFCVGAGDIDEEATAKANGGADSDATDAPATTAAGATTSSEDDEDDEGSAGGVIAGGSGSDDDEADATGEADDDDATGGVTSSGSDSDADASDEEDDDDASGKADDPDATDDDDGSVCFPAGATVELENGAVLRMADLSVGDMVKVGVNEFSRVFMFTHKMADEAHTFVSLKTESGAALELTAGHYLYANGALVAAKTVSVGDVLTLGNGETSAVTAVGSVEGTGLFNPQTVNGNVVVNGVVSSTYTTAVEPTFAHAILAPFRMLNNFGFSFTALESGGGALADVAPRGQAVF